jgi:hypothetical protein
MFREIKRVLARAEEVEFAGRVVVSGPSSKPRLTTGSLSYFT